MADLFDEHVTIERPNIPEFLDRLRRFGDKAAAEEVLNYYITCYGKRVLYYLRHLGLKDDAAEWICNETFTKFWLDQAFEPGEGELSYFFTIARNSTRDYWRREKKFRAMPITESGENTQDKKETPDKTVANCEEEEKLIVAISRLPKKERKAIRLLLKGKSLLEIARALGVPKPRPSAASYWLKKAKENLQRQLNIELEGEIS